ncbi:MAG: hypothetical protein D6739_04265 [Nitrospirae bacterium]|nr:MAG: hypothetical protein D6739_04265 [Nitrospirota bacterium]
MGSSLVVGPGEVVSSVVAFGGTVTVSRGAVVEGDAVAFGGTVTLEEGSVVEGDVVAFGGSVLVQRGVLVEGDTVSFGGAIDVEEGALVEGSRVGPPRHAQRPTRPERTRPRADRSAEPSGLSRVLARGTWVTLAFLAVFTLGWALLALMPRRMDRMQRALARSPGKAMLAGLLASLALVPLCVLLGITGIGLLLVPLALVGFGIAVLTGWVVAAVATGRRLPHRFRRTPVVELMVGLLLFWGLGLFTGVPFLGILAGLALLLATFAGLGGVLLSRFGMPPKATDAAMDPPPEGLTTEEASPAR